jgi:hypothetical protein
VRNKLSSRTCTFLSLARIDKCFINSERCFFVILKRSLAKLFEDKARNFFFLLLLLSLLLFVMKRY